MMVPFLVLIVSMTSLVIQGEAQLGFDDPESKFSVKSENGHDLDNFDSYMSESGSNNDNNYGSSHIEKEHKPGCEFPDDWLGEWYLEGRRDPINLGKEDFAEYGMCFKQTGNIHVMYNRDRECYQCFVFFDRHPNVLQFQEGNCKPLFNGEEDALSVEEICSDTLKAEPTLKNLVKVSGPDIPCPFRGKFTVAFSKRGGPLCKNKKSQLDECMTDSQVAFRFKQCQGENGHDNKRGLLLPQLLMENANTGVEILTCKGHWTADEGGGGGEPSAGTRNAGFLIGLLDHALVSRIDQKIQCFIYRHTHNENGFVIGQSSSCHGLNSVEDGERIIHLIPVSEEELPSSPNCTFPTWATSLGSLKSLTYTSHYEFSNNGTSFTLSNYSYISGDSHQIAVTTCLDVQEETPNENIKLITRVTAGCDTQYKCMKLFRRTDDVIEIQEGRLTTYKGHACSTEFMEEQKLPFTTLLKSDPPMRHCSANGFYNVTELNLKGTTDPCSPVGFGQISIRCKQPELIQFIQECGSVKDSEFFCLGGWEEVVPYSSLLGSIDDRQSRFQGGYSLFQRNKDYNSYTITDNEQGGNEPFDLSSNVTLGFLIARPKGEEENAPRRVCFTYMAVNDTEYSWTVYTAACLRNIRPGQDGLFKFNATKLESCNGNSLNVRQLTLMMSLVFWTVNMIQATFC